MKIKKGDTVTVITGKDAGKTGKVLRALPRLGKVVVEGVNMLKKHRRPTRRGGKGQTVAIASPIHESNVARADRKPRGKTRGRSASGTARAQ